MMVGSEFVVLERLMGRECGWVTLRLQVAHLWNYSTVCEQLYYVYRTLDGRHCESSRRELACMTALEQLRRG